MKTQVILFVLGGAVGLLTSTPMLLAQACYNSAVSGAYGFNGTFGCRGWIEARSDARVWQLLFHVVLVSLDAAF